MAGEDEVARDELLRDIPVVAFRLDVALRIVGWNRVMERIFGVSSAEVVGRRVDAVIPTEAGLDGWRALLAEPQGTRQVWATRDAAGQALLVAFIVQPLVGPDGAPAGARMFGRDLTAEHAAEQARLALIERQEQAIRRLGVPIIEVWDRILALPILGVVDDERAAELTERLLEAVVAARARIAVLDLTGVDEIDLGTARHLLDLVGALRLLGAEGVLTGVRPEVAGALVQLDVDLSDLHVHASLRDALRRWIPALAGRAR